MEERDLFDSARNVPTLDAYFAWAQRCDNRLEFLRKKCRVEHRIRSVGTINFLIARIVRLIGVRDDLRWRFEREGGGVERREGFSWSEIETAFIRRVLTGVIINFDRVRDVIDRYDSIKVNTAFNGEFVASDKIAVKIIATKNHSFLPTSDLREWYGRHVVAILASL